MLFANLPFFFLGLFWGSFLGVVADRAERPRSIILDRSRCDHCQKILSWVELIPLFSFLLQKGRCRQCGAKLSLKYPVVEILTGILTFAIAIKIKETQTPFFLGLFDWFFFSLLLVIAFSDYLHKEFNSWLVYALAALVVFDVFIKGIFLSNTHKAFLPTVFEMENWGVLATFLNHFFGGLFGFLLPLSLFFLTKKRGIGDGDIWLGAILGLFLGFYSTLNMFFLAFTAGAVVASFLILFKKAKLKSQIAFSPFLASAAFFVYLFL